MTPPVEILVVGDGPVASALEPMIHALGWTPRLASDFRTVSEHLAAAAAVVVLSHHEDLDGPAIRAALAAGTPYVGAMGSRRTQARRRDWLLDQGVNEAELGALRAPIGLDIGADDPGEIAVSVLAEIVAVRRGANGGAALRDREGPLHPELAPGTATCPGG
jgi:xanthine dehydrogenase accessory factor